MLEDGKIYKGKSFGAQGEVVGEVVFNTSMTGYQEILTDPSYHEQIVTMTYPQIGNYGVNSKDVESEKVRVAGFVVREYLDYYSNWEAEGSLKDYLKKYNIIAISDIDTRDLTMHIRIKGAMNGILSTKSNDICYLQEKIKAYPGLIGRDLAKQVTCEEAYYFNNKKSGKYHIVALDYGIKYSILRCLEELDFSTYVMPATTDAKTVLQLNPDAIFFSNGPGDPSAIDYAVKNISDLLGKKPVFGICLGHQLMSLALGAKTYKLKFGHHGGNHPVMKMADGSVEITTQNHGFNVDIDSLQQIKGLNYKLSHINLNDQTIEGIAYPDLFAFSVQYHPEAAPGPHDSRYIFKEFVELIEDYRKKNNA